MSSNPINYVENNNIRAELERNAFAFQVRFDAALATGYQDKLKEVDLKLSKFSVSASNELPRSDSAAKDNGDAPDLSQTHTRIIAKFHPQAWVNDSAISVDPEGEVTFDVTQEILKIGLIAALEMDDDDYETDELRESENAPEWIKDWGGPFYIEVKASIQDYVDAVNKKSGDEPSKTLTDIDEESQAEQAMFG